VSLDPLVTQDEIEERLDRDLTATEIAGLPAKLRDASAAVRSFCRRDFTAVIGDVLRIKPIGDRVRLPNAPVTAVTSVKRVNADGSTQAFAGWAWDGGENLFGLCAMGSPMINVPEAWLDDDYTPMVEVTYDHGDTEVPDTVAAVVCAMIIRVLNAPGGGVEGLRSETIGPYAYGLAGATPGKRPRLSEEDKKELREAGFGTARLGTVMLR